HLALAALEGVGRDAVVLHELVQRLAGDAAKTRSRNAEAFELAIVEAANDRLLTDLADLGGFASRENGLHACSIPSWPGLTPQHTRRSQGLLSDQKAAGPVSSLNW